MSGRRIRRKSMDFTTLLFLALGLSMDAFAVSISNGLSFRNYGKKEALFTSFAFGFFQALMPVIGFFAGQIFAGAIQAVDHWVALVLLGYIGGKMIFDAVRELRHPQECEVNRTLTLRMVMMQAVATSIDALAVGISLSLMKVNIAFAASAIGVITFLCCTVGSLLGKKFGSMLKEKAEIAGGLILVAIGIKIFVEHIFGL